MADRKSTPRVRNPDARKPPQEPPPPSRGIARGLWFLIRHLCFWSVLVAIAYWLWLDREVVTAFENRRWDLPARVFARPLELYAGATLAPARLLRELEQLGYEEVAAPGARGQYARARAHVDFHSRGFAFWDGPEPSRAVRVQFAAGKVAQIVELGTQAVVDLMRLEPLEIGRINPQRFEDRKLLKLDEVPPEFVAALVAVEDRRFFRHHGVDFMGLARALWVNVLAQRVAQGGSTLTQQLVKNLYLSHARTVTRKVKEMLMAVSLERRYSKKEIIETYINEVFLGQDGDRAIHGFELAANFYFAKPLGELDPAERAMLIGMVKGPTAFDPRRHPERARKRRDTVLAVMAEADLLTPAQLAAWRARPLRLHAGGRPGGRDFPAFMAVVRRQLLREYDADVLNAAGLNIFTTLDVDVQRAAELGVARTLDAIEKSNGRKGLQGAFVAAAPASGEILAMVSDRNPQYAGFNRAVDARRPIGSLVKPFVYAAALDQPERYSLLTPLADVAVNWTDERGRRWTPKNYDADEHGEVTLLYALTRSLNLATVNLGLRLGLDNVARYLEHLGLGERLPAYPSLLLGAVDLSPLALAEMYTVVANDGFRIPLRAISAVTDQQQRKLNRYALRLKPVMQPATAALVRYALTQVVAQGTARALVRELPGITPLAGKTGTSNDSRDSWFAGFGGNLLAVAWVGRDDNAPVGLTGSSGALKVWAATMREVALEGLKPSLPADVEWQRVALMTSEVLPAECPGGSLIPLHRRSPRSVRVACGAARPEPPASGTILDRFRNVWPQATGR